MVPGRKAQSKPRGGRVDTLVPRAASKQSPSVITYVSACCSLSNSRLKKATCCILRRGGKICVYALVS